MDLISIIIPVYNTGKYLTACLDSCLNQTYSNLEIIVIDDHSTDPLTCEILHKYQQLDPRLKVIFSAENRGQGYRRNEGLKYAHGKYFAYIDSDDTFVPNAIEHLHDVIIKYQTDFVQSDVHNFDAEEVLNDRIGFTSESINNTCRELFNYNGEADQPVDLPNLIKEGQLFSVPALCYGKLFNTERYLAAHVLFDEGPFSRHCQDEDWSTLMLLQLKSFVYTKFVSINRFILRESASAPSVNYYKSALNACVRRYKLVNQPDLLQYYGDSVTSFAYSRVELMLNCSKSEDEDQELCQFAAETLQSINGLHLNHIYPSLNNVNTNLFNINRVLEMGHSQRQPTVLYFSLQNLLDISDPDMLTCRCLLEHLAAQGFRVSSLGGKLTKKAKGNTLYEKLLLSQRPQSLGFFKQMPAIERVHINGLNHFSVNLTINHLGQEHLLVQADASLLRAALMQLFGHLNPDILIYSGSDPITFKLVQSIYQAYQAAQANPSNTKAKSSLSFVYLPRSSKSQQFNPVCDLIATFTPAHTQRLVDRLKAALPADAAELAASKCQALGYPPYPTWDVSKNNILNTNLDFQATIGSSLIEEGLDMAGQAELANPNNAATPAAIPQNILDLDRQRQNGAITLLYPEPENGLAIMVALLMYCAQHHPEQKFIVVNVPNTPLAANLAKLHDAAGRNLAQLRPNMSQLQIISAAEDMDELFNQTKLLLWFPAQTTQDSMVPLFAAWQGIKVLATATPEISDCLESSFSPAVQQQAFGLAPMPPSTLADNTCLPNEEELQPFIQALEHLLSTEHTARAGSQQRAYIKANVDNWCQALLQLVPEDKHQPLPQLYHLF